MARIIIFFAVAFLSIGCLDISQNCLDDVLENVSIKTCMSIDSSDLIAGRNYSFIGNYDTLNLLIDNQGKFIEAIEFKKMVFTKGNEILDVVYFSIVQNSIEIAFSHDIIDSLTGLQKVYTHRMKINGDNENNSPIDQYDPCKGSLRCKDIKNSRLGICCYRIELKHPNDYHGEEVNCPGVEKIDLWMVDLEHPKIIALQYKGKIYTLEK